MKSLTLLLKGGLGNQMFQYAAARSISQKYNCNLYIDTKTGFNFDYKFNRKLEINQLNTIYKESSSFKKIPLWFFGKSARKALSKKNFSYYLFSFFKYGYLLDNNRNFISKLNNIENINNLFIDGYFQSHLYFQNISSQICNELKPPQSQKNNFRKIATSMRKQNSVAICLRLYEEVKNPNIHLISSENNRKRRLKKIIKEISHYENDLKLYVFCTHKNKFIYDLDLPQDSVLITEDNGFKGTIDNLWLMTNCKHHIITNSSFYWWGAWLSSRIYNSERKRVYISKDFMNNDCKPDKWIYF